MSQRRQFSPSQQQILGANLVEARTHAGIKTAAKAADGAKMHATRLSLWETGQITPELRGLIELAVLYQCPVDRFLSGVDPRYDAIIESPIALDVRRHYEAKMEAFVAGAADFLQRARAGAIAPSPTGGAGMTPSETGKSSRVRARRKRGK